MIVVMTALGSVEMIVETIVVVGTISEKIVDLVIEETKEIIVVVETITETIVMGTIIQEIEIEGDIEKIVDGRFFKDVFMYEVLPKSVTFYYL